MSGNDYYAAPSNGQPPIIVVQGTPVPANEPLPPPPPAGNSNSNMNMNDNVYNGSGYPTAAYVVGNSNLFEKKQQQMHPMEMAHDGYNLTSNNNSNNSWKKNHERKFQDVPFTILFVVHLCIMGYLCAVNAHKLYDGEGGEGGERLRRLSLLMSTSMSSSNQGYNDEIEESYNYLGRFLEDEDGKQYWHSGMFQAEQEDGSGDGELNATSSMVYTLLAFSGLFASLFSGLSLSFMMRFSEGLIKISLIFNCVMYFLIGMVMLMGGAVGPGLFCLFLFAIAACYAHAVWGRIPFAAVNMKTAISAVKNNIGVVLYAYIASLILFLWTIWWFITFVTTLEVQQPDEENDEDVPEANGFAVFLLLLSFHWTQQVISNVVHVTVSGVVGTWWFAPEEASSCCSRATRDSFFRATTYSFGSICMGSLLVAIVEALRDMMKNARENDDGILVCLADCCLMLIEAALEYFNRWAFVYVGLYGFGFIESGKNVINLFKSRGWTTIITDNLCDRVLLLVALGIGILTGFFVDLIMMTFDGVAGNDSALLLFFFVGFLIGLSLSLVLFGTISSSIAAVIVCYAESPNDFDRNHPELSNEMREKWRQAWPDEFKF